MLCSEVNVLEAIAIIAFCVLALKLLPAPAKKPKLYDRYFVKEEKSDRE